MSNKYKMMRSFPTVRVNGKYLLQLPLKAAVWFQFRNEPMYGGTVTLDPKSFTKVGRSDSDVEIQCFNDYCTFEFARKPSILKIEFAGLELQSRLINITDPPIYTELHNPTSSYNSHPLIEHYVQSRISNLDYYKEMRRKWFNEN